ncbi:galactose-1-phosphate uridylyltransferase [Saxibacter everestensis]|uniref:Galactose-1-phosphate uridylyltransferase n=2 Tax=Saxibacter everestensis TaxID=2909229 RepID=A0ABY8R0I6_9MICO|nr:galactose-1-phosphate uridylyltransferase [Brevibacteriaceae bacterium ZFBP1038]
MVRKTTSRLADGRELIYFDDTEPYVSAAAVREAVDVRPLSPREPAPRSAASTRRDPVSGEWVTIAAHRMDRTFLPPADESPLAPTGPGQKVPGEIPDTSYNVVVFENRFPSLEGPPTTYRDEPLRQERSASGRCEVICFTDNPATSFAELPLSRVRTIVEALTDRTRELSALDGVRQVFPFENRGEEIGVTLHHPHGQIYAYPFLPARTQALVEQSIQHKQQTGRKLLDDVVAVECAEGTRVVLETEHFVGFVPFAAKWPVHVQLHPRRDVADLTELRDEERADLAVAYRELLRRLDRFFDRPLPYIANWQQAPVGEGRDHGRLYIELFSLLRSPTKLKYLAGSESAAGAWINDTTPEAIADRLREVATQ